jgi:hypothetical protein
MKNQKSVPKAPVQTEQQILEHINRRAYELWQASGRPDGNAMANWIQAEREIRAQLGNQRSVN